MSGSSLSVGELVDSRFEITGTLGAGGFGVVYAARQLSTGQPVAIKVMNDAAEMANRSRFEREMRVIARLQHPHIVRLLDFGCLPDGRLFTVLVFVEGQDLATYIKARGPMPEDEAVALMRQVLDALHHAHQLGIVHRDLKPANIMVLPKGLHRHAMVLDFGIAGVVEGARGPEYVSLTTQSGVIGTPSYMAPEQLKGQLNPATDLYAWGLVLLECLTGKVVVEASTPMEAMATQLSTEPVPVPPALAKRSLGRLIAQVVDKDPDRRLPTAADVMQQLDAPTRQLPQLRWLITAIAAAALGLAIGLVIAPGRPEQPAPVAPATAPSTAPAAPSTAWVTDRTEAWRLAWERTAPRGETAAFAQFYDAALQADGRDHAAFLAHRANIGKTAGWVKVQLDDLQARRLEDGRVEVTLQQRYRTTSYSDQGRKTLVWAQAGGVWRIVEETFVATPP
jgi:hypothetical protein